MSFTTFFDKIYCINLKTNDTRWSCCKEEFRSQGIRKPIRFEAVKGIPDGFTQFGSMGVSARERNYQQKIAGRVGCLLSHLAIIKQAKELDLKTILILEDDIQFVQDANKIFSAIEAEIPQNWDFLYLGGNEKDKLQKVSTHICSTSHMLMTHAVAVSANVFDDIINTISACELPVDVYYAQLQKKVASYTVYPFIAWQRAGWSEIEQRFRVFDLNHGSPSLEKIFKCNLNG